MPNWPLSEGIREHLEHRAKRVSQRVVDLAETGFPLTKDQLQYAVLPEEHVSTLIRLEREGVQTIPRHDQLYLAIIKEALDENALPRSVILEVELRGPGIFVPRSTNIYGVNWAASKFGAREHHYLVPDLDRPRDGLPEEAVITQHDRKRLMGWIDGALRQRRLSEIVTNIAPEVLNLAPTTQHLLSWWPMLTKLVEPEADARRNRSHADFTKQWIERFRNPVRRGASGYQPTPSFQERYVRLIQAADVILNSGMMLDDEKDNSRSKVKAEIVHWERLEKDLKFPLPAINGVQMRVNLTGVLGNKPFQHGG